MDTSSIEIFSFVVTGWKAKAIAFALLAGLVGFGYLLGRMNG